MMAKRVDDCACSLFWTMRPGESLRSPLLQLLLPRCDPGMVVRGRCVRACRACADDANIETRQLVCYLITR